MKLDTNLVVGPFEYERRDYTPKRRGQEAGHGWVRQKPRAEVGLEAKVLIDEIVRLRYELDEAQLRLIEARNPGIDIEEVRQSRACGEGIETDE